MTKVADAASGPAPERALRVSALLGVAVWLLAHHWLLDGLLPSVMAFAVLVVAPLAVGLAPRPPSNGPALPELVGILQPVAAAGVLWSLTLKPSLPTALFCVPWLAWTLVLLVVGARWVLSKDRSLSTTAAGSGMALVPIGAGWLVLSRAGLDPAGFGVVIVFLTGIHFHYVALGVPALVSLSARAVVAAELEPSRQHSAIRLLWFVLGSAWLGMLLVAIGISFSSVIGLLGALALTVGLFGYAWVVSNLVARGRVRARRGQLGVARALLVISACSALLSMPLAMAWAYGQVVGDSVVNLSWMIRLHGMANAHGVIGVGLAGFWLLTRTAKGTR